MNTTYIIIAVVLILVVGAILGPIFARRKRSEQLHDHFGTEYDHTVQALGGEKKAQTELEERQKHVESLGIHPLSVAERDRGHWLHRSAYEPLWHKLRASQLPTSARQA